MFSFCNEKFAPDPEAGQAGRPGDSPWKNDQDISSPAQLAQDDVAGFYQALRPSLIAFLRRRNLTVEQTEDVVQEAFLRLLCRTPKDIQAGNVRFWIFRVAQNLATDIHRSAVRFGWNPQEVMEAVTSATPCNSFNPEEQFLHTERWRSVQENMAKLTPRQRDAIHLRICGVSSMEIAVQLRTTPHSVEELIRRGLNRLGRVKQAPPSSQKSKNVCHVK
jgi:RNA polymerase sigma-70 factor, ECF subfamily